MATECPQCGIINLPNAPRCDCGYDLGTRPSLNMSGMSFKTLFFSLDGRIGLSTYWFKFSLPYFVLCLALIFLDRASGTLDLAGGIGLFSGIFILLTSYPSIAVGVKRCHDRDMSGWFLLVGLIPLLNLWVLVELGFSGGMVGPNRYGLPEMRTA
jgi:uncharacterized membrane protein YhaH (DUF805 family)